MPPCTPVSLQHVTLYILYIVVIGSDLSLHGEGPGRAGTGEDAANVKPVRFLSSLLARGLGGGQ